MMKDHEFSTKLMITETFYPFEIVLVLFVNNNISSKIFCSAAGSVILRFARNTSYCSTFIMLVNAPHSQAVVKDEHTRKPKGKS